MGRIAGSFITHSVIGVSINPGWMQLTRMPCGVISADMLRVRASSPSLVGAAGEHLGGLDRSDVDDGRLPLFGDDAAAEHL
jgi:hypothetical protein